MRLTPRTELAWSVPHTRRHLISPRSPRAMIPSGSKWMPGVVAIWVHSAMQASLPSWLQDAQDRWASIRAG
jgi:hypothetical protein